MVDFGPADAVKVMRYTEEITSRDDVRRVVRHNDRARVMGLTFNCGEGR